MAQVIQSGTDTFASNNSITFTKAVTFGTALTSTTNVQIIATPKRTFKQIANPLRNVVSISYDPTTLTTTGVTFTAVVNKGYVGSMAFDYIVIVNT